MDAQHFIQSLRQRLTKRPERKSKLGPYFEAHGEFQPPYYDPSPSPDQIPSHQRGKRGTADLMDDKGSSPHKKIKCNPCPPAMTPLANIGLCRLPQSRHERRPPQPPMEPAMRQATRLLEILPRTLQNLYKVPTYEAAITYDTPPRAERETRLCWTVPTETLSELRVDGNALGVEYPRPMTKVRFCLHIIASVGLRRDLRCRETR